MFQLTQSDRASSPLLPFCSILAQRIEGDSPAAAPAPSTVRRALFYTRSVDSNANLIQKHLHRHPEIRVNLRTPWPVRLTCKLNHHRERK